jgi:hypothetical protein
MPTFIYDYTQETMKDCTIRCGPEGTWPGLQLKKVTDGEHHCMMMVQFSPDVVKWGDMADPEVHQTWPWGSTWSRSGRNSSIQQRLKEFCNDIEDPEVDGYGSDLNSVIPCSSLPFSLIWKECWDHGRHHGSEGDEEKEQCNFKIYSCLHCALATCMVSGLFPWVLISFLCSSVTAMAALP